MTYPVLNDSRQSIHKVFVSYHHEIDQTYMDLFGSFFTYIDNIHILGSERIGDIETNMRARNLWRKIRYEYLQDTTVTVVLVGAETWKRKHVDWEIGASIQQTQNGSRSGLLGIILPTYPRTNPQKYNPYTIPPRLFDNVNCGFAKIYNWTEKTANVQRWIHQASKRINWIKPDNSSLPYKENRARSRRQC